MMKDFSLTIQRNAQNGPNHRTVTFKRAAYRSLRLSRSFGPLQHSRIPKGRNGRKWGVAEWLPIFLIAIIAGAINLLHSSTAFCQEEEEEEPAEVYTYLLSLSMEELTQIPIQSSGLFAMNWNEAPGISYIVQKEQLDNTGIRTLGEYINRQIPGMSTATHGTQGTIIGVRGMLIDNTAKTLLLRDNLNLNNKKFVGINGSELSSPLLGDIDTIEVTLGPSVMRHGSGAINGSINMISATGKSKEGIRLNTSYGSGDSRQVEGSYGYILNDKANLFFYAGYNKSNGVRPEYTFSSPEWASLNGVSGTPSTTFLDNVRVGKTDDDYKFSFRAQYGQPADFMSIDFKAMVSHTSNVDPVLGEYLGDHADWTEEVKLAAEARDGRYSPFYEQQADNVLISPEITININEQNKIQITPYYQTIKTLSVFSDFLLDEVGRLNITLQPIGSLDCEALNCAQEYTYGDELHLGTTMIHTYDGFEKQKIAWGAEAKYFEFKDQPWSWTTISALGEDQIQLGAFSFLAGLRYDKTYFEDEIDTIPPYNDGPYKAPDDVDAFTLRLASSYHINEQQTVKLSYQEGFRFADAWFQQWIAHTNQENGTNRQVYPEESQNYEANYTAIGLLDHSLNIYTTLFYNIYKDTQAYLPGPETFGNSTTKIKSIGGEFSLEYHPVAPLDIKLSYSYAHPLDSFDDAVKVANEDDTWTRYPEHMVKFQLGYELLPNFFASTTGLLNSPFYEKEEVTDPKVQTLFDDWSLVMDANLRYILNPHTQITLAAKDLIHKNYNQNPAYFNGTRPLDSPRPDSPQYYLTLSFRY